MRLTDAEPVKREEKMVEHKLNNDAATGGANGLDTPVSVEMVGADEAPALNAAVSVPREVGQRLEGGAKHEGVGQHELTGAEKLELITVRHPSACLCMLGFKLMERMRTLQPVVYGV